MNEDGNVYISIFVKSSGHVVLHVQVFRFSSNLHVIYVGEVARCNQSCGIHIGQMADLAPF